MYISYRNDTIDMAEPKTGVSGHQTYADYWSLIFNLIFVRNFTAQKTQVDLNYVELDPNFMYS